MRTIKSYRLASKLYYLRKAHGIRLSVLAKLMGVSESLLSYAENGKRNLNSETLKKLAEFYHLIYPDFFEDKTNPINPPPINKS